MGEWEKAVKVKENASRGRSGLAEPLSNGGFVFDISVGAVDREGGFSSSDFIMLILVVQFDTEHLGQAVTNLRCSHIDDDLSKAGGG